MSIIPGAILDPGVHWNYQAGRTSCLMCVWHYTVGRDSRALIRNNGLAPILIWPDVIWQYAPLDARCFTQCEWNGRAIGYEVESLDGSITDGAIALLGYATSYAIATYGIPQDFYDGPRLPVGFDFRGVTNHRNLIHHACDMHSDGFDRWVWDAAMNPPEDDMLPMLPTLIHDDAGDGRAFLYDPGDNTKTYLPSLQAIGALFSYWDFVAFVSGGQTPVPSKTFLRSSDPNVGAWVATLIRSAVENTAGTVVVPGPGGGATKAEVEAIVKADGALTRTEVAKPRPLVLAGNGSVG